MMIMLYLFTPAILCSNPPVSCTWYHWLYSHLCSSLLATWLLLHHSPGEFHWLPWILMSRFWSLERMDSPCCWSEWRSGSVDPQHTIGSFILPGPLCASRVFLVV